MYSRTFGIGLLCNIYTQQEDPRALDRSPESWLIRRLFDLWLNRYHVNIFLCLALVAIFNWTERSERFWHYEEHFCEIILNLDQWFKEMCRFKIFLIQSSLAAHLFDGAKPIVQLC